MSPESTRPVLKEFYQSSKLEVNKRRPKIEPVRHRQVGKVLANYVKGAV